VGNQTIFIIPNLPSNADNFDISLLNGGDRYQGGTSPWIGPKSSGVRKSSVELQDTDFYMSPAIQAGNQSHIETIRRSKTMGGLFAFDGTSSVPIQNLQLDISDQSNVERRIDYLPTKSTINVSEQSILNLAFFDYGSWQSAERSSINISSGSSAKVPILGTKADYTASGEGSRLVIYPIKNSEDTTAPIWAGNDSTSINAENGAKVRVPGDWVYTPKEINISGENSTVEITSWNWHDSDARRELPIEGLGLLRLEGGTSLHIEEGTLKAKEIQMYNENTATIELQGGTIEADIKLPENFPRWNPMFTGHGVIDGDFISGQIRLTGNLYVTGDVGDVVIDTAEILGPDPGSGYYQLNALGKIQSFTGVRYTNYDLSGPPFNDPFPNMARFTNGYLPPRGAIFNLITSETRMDLFFNQSFRQYASIDIPSNYFKYPISATPLGLPEGYMARMIVTEKTLGFEITAVPEPSPMHYAACLVLVVLACHFRERRASANNC
jgi:hypothetical protein